jgi:hypothetical protein
VVQTKAHGGELRVEAKEGEGAEFIVQLPLRENFLKIIYEDFILPFCISFFSHLLIVFLRIPLLMFSI